MGVLWIHIFRQYDFWNLINLVNEKGDLRGWMSSSNWISTFWAWNKFFESHSSFPNALGFSTKLTLATFQKKDFDLAQRKLKVRNKRKIKLKWNKSKSQNHRNSKKKVEQTLQQLYYPEIHSRSLFLLPLNQSIENKFIVRWISDSHNSLSTISTTFTFSMNNFKEIKRRNDAIDKGRKLTFNLV